MPNEIPPTDMDRITRRVVNLLGVIVIIGLIGAIVLAYFGKSIPEIILGVCGIGVGALAFIITRGRGQFPPHL